MRANKFWVFLTAFFAVLSCVLAVKLAALSFSVDGKKAENAETRKTGNPDNREKEKKNVRSLYEMRVTNVEINDNRISLTLGAAPDIGVAGEYITVEPAPKGGLSFTDSSYDSGYSGRRHVISIEGDFAYDVNHVVKIRKGFPVKESVYDTKNAIFEPLSEDFTYAFKRQGITPKVKFCGNGRYLSPVGVPSLKIECVNVSNFEAEIRAIHPENLVQMLSLEDDMYVNIWGRSGFQKDISSPLTTVPVSVKSAPNETKEHVLQLNVNGGPLSKGIYFVSLTDEEETFREKGRVVCITDLGLSVRQVLDETMVWVSSLSKGVPVEGVDVQLYSSENKLIAKGRTNEQGLFRCPVKSDEYPYAVVATSPDGSDRSFISFSEKTSVTESFGGSADWYLDEGELDAFAWTERDIYRHGEKIFVHAILRDSKRSAPKPTPIQLSLRRPDGVVVAERTLMTDSLGAVSCGDLSVDEAHPSGEWKICLSLPGQSKTAVMTSLDIKVEDFAPPQIRVKVSADKKASPKDFSFEVSAEHLHGGPGALLLCDGGVAFEDVVFAPAQWKGWSFGDESRSLRPNYRRLKKTRLDSHGKAVLSAPLWSDTGLPSAAVRAIVQGVVFEDGGRPAAQRDTAVLHYYPYYIGTTLQNWMHAKDGERPRISVACVNPDGSKLKTPKRLLASIERIDTVNSYVKMDDGAMGWKSDRVKTTVKKDIVVEVGSEGISELTLPVAQSADYQLTVSDPDSDVRYVKTFYLGDFGTDESATAPMSNPWLISIAPDKKFYRPGETPKLRVRSPFAGRGLLSVFRSGILYTENIVLTNATTELTLRPVDDGCVSSIDVSLVVVNGVSAESGHVSARAHGETSVFIRNPMNEIAVSGSAKYSNGLLDVSVAAQGAKQVVITVVDEGINLLTVRKTPDPVSYFARYRRSLVNGYYDLYGSLLPVIGQDMLKISGLKTGGDVDASLLSRVSPVGSRRFKPFSLWKTVPVADGKARAEFALGEFSGEVRVTAVAYSGNAAGAVDFQHKIVPNLIMRPDAPRFVAPNDEYQITFPLENRSGRDGSVSFKITEKHKNDASGASENAYSSNVVSGGVFVKDGSTKILPYTLKAPDAPGAVTLVFEATGFGETHKDEIELPVRPAAPWRQTSGVAELKTGDAFEIPEEAERANLRTFSYKVSESEASKLSDALEWLADYPHGCLEQTVSRVFPLIAAGGVLNAFSPIAATNREHYVSAGVSRVMSMFVGESYCSNAYFTMWPDVNDPVENNEVALFASHFLVEAKKSSVGNISSRDIDNILHGVRRYIAQRDNYSREEVAYACHTLALAGSPNKGCMYELYDNRESLSLLARARLARAFSLVGNRKCALELLNVPLTASGVVDASFALLALLETDPDDKRIAELVMFINSKRADSRMSWGTTTENSHAVYALGEYFRRRPAATALSNVEKKDNKLINSGAGTAFVSWKRLELPAPDGKDEACGISVKREFLTADGDEYDVAKASRGDFVIVKLSLTALTDIDVSDIVIEDLFAGAMESVRMEVSPVYFPWIARDAHKWVMRSDVRDDRMLVFSKKLKLDKGNEVCFYYPLRVVSAGSYALPALAAEAMYMPELRARSGYGRVVVGD